MIETAITSESESECFLKREFVDFVKRNYIGRPLMRKELKLVVEIIFHECLHHKIYAIFGFSPKCSLGLKAGEKYHIDINAGCHLKTDCSLSEYLILTFVDVLQLIYDIIVDLFDLDLCSFFWRIRTFIVEFIQSFSVLK